MTKPKILVKFDVLEDILPLLYGLQSSDLKLHATYFHLINQNYEFHFYTDNKKYILPNTSLTKHNQVDYDLKIQVSSKNQFSGDYSDIKIYTQIEEPLFIDDDTISNLKDTIIVTSTEFSNFTHKNLYSDYTLSFYYFYHYLAFSFLNYYENTHKSNLLGMYVSEAQKMCSRQHRLNEYNNIKNILGDDVNDYSIENFKLKELINNYASDSTIGFGNWKKNHISSYTDMVDSVVFLINETNLDDTQSTSFRITEKTLKALLFSKSKCFFIWSGQSKMFEKLIDSGYWFLNKEFYKGDIHKSIIETVTYLKKLKDKFGDNENVYAHLLNEFGENLEHNYQIIKTHLNESSSSILEDIIKKV